MKYILSLLLVAMFFAACQHTHQPTETSDSPNYKIAYNVLVDEANDNYEVFVMNLDGSEKTNISNSPGVDWVYYAFKDKVYFVSDRDTAHRNYFLWEMKVDGSAKRRVSDLRLEDCYFSSRHNGQEFIVRPHRSIDSVLYIIDHTGNLVQKVDPGMVYCNDLYFSPDGNRIVFRGADKKSKREEGFLDELYIMDLQTNERHKITTYPKEDTTAEWYAYHAGPPIWNPVTDLISYPSKQKGIHSIFAVKPDGSGLKQITTDGFDAIWHTWSADGKYLVTDGTGTTGDNYDIYLLPMDDTVITRLTTDTLYEQGPVFVEF
ncbi:MAG TPA: hypothetical protein P5514_15450 [Bacteroidales bacterium]|nr:hypothetical protein [Bacteroidales bacterium]HRX98340.1 hypothetical protein [Bacteroidales bacterium]